MIPGSNKIVPGVDFFFTDELVLRYLTARNFEIDKACEAMMYQLEWRQTNVPLALLTDRTLKLMSMGLIYLHGRCMDGTPIMYVDLVKLTTMLKENLICEHSFGSLHNFYAGYIIRNMLIPGQVEKWIIILNINHFSVKKLPVKMFKECAKELS